MSGKQIYSTPSAWAFAALIAGNVCIAFGPLLVRLSDTGPIATGFWRVALAVPVLAFIGYRAGFRIGSMPGKTLGLVLLGGFFFGIDIIAWHIGIFQTKLGNATLLANCASPPQRRRTSGLAKCHWHFSPLRQQSGFFFLRSTSICSIM